MVFEKAIIKRGHMFDDMMNYILDANFDLRQNYRDVVSEFWETYIKHTVGSDIEITTTVHIMKREHYNAEGYMPIQLSQVVQDEKLLNMFLCFLPTVVRETFEMALNDVDSVDEEDLCNYFQAMPTKDIIRNLCWSRLFQCYLRSLLPRTELEEVYKNFHVTNKNVLNLLQLLDNISKAEKLTLDALRQYIKRCITIKLTSFL
ncbi:hypothetical protein ACJMK2_026893 [Sinanodonta woodiana]|uniref:Uncharacterized protein n=1 Tax=Sinanodonta woodiana TaxID=1069815 RepID=A0ABD3XL23_SINWO